MKRQFIPDAENEYNCSLLEKLIHEQASIEITNVDDLVLRSVKFDTITEFLKRKTSSQRRKPASYIGKAY